MGSVGDAYDNALSESFNATLEKELVRGKSYRTKAEARRSIFDYIEAFYNPKRRHYSLGQLSPVEFERSFQQEVDWCQRCLDSTCPRERVNSIMAWTV